MSETTGLHLSTAKAAAAAAVELARKNGWKIAVAVVNIEGQLMYFERDADAFCGSFETALAKAYSAAAYRLPSAYFAQAIAEGRHEISTLPRMCAVPGGVPLKTVGGFIGAIGVSGAKPKEDAECAIAGASALA